MQGEGSAYDHYLVGDSSTPAAFEATIAKAGFDFHEAPYDRDAYEELKTHERTAVQAAKATGLRS